ncbi:unnamed protein product, partial [Staurois parvus]
ITATYLSLGPVVCPPQPVSPAVLDSRRPASLVWAPGCDSLRLHRRVPTAHARVALRFMNGPVVFWDLSRVQKTTRREDVRTPAVSDRQGQGPEMGAGTCQMRVPAPQKVPILKGEQSLKRNFPFWVELRFRLKQSS